MNRARTSRYASDDHADDLLAEIFDSTEESARAEQAERERQLAQKNEAQRRARAEAEAARIAAQQAKLAEELARQDQLAQRRTQRLQALRLAEQPAQTPPEETATAPGIDEEALRREITAEVRQELRALVNTPVPTAPAPVAAARRSTGFIAGAIVVVAALGIAISGFALGSRYQPDPNPYAKAVFAPLDRDAVALEVATLPIPSAPEAVAPPAAPSATPVRVRAPRAVVTKKQPTSSFARPTEKSQERKSWEALNAALDNANDPFSGKD